MRARSRRRTPIGWPTSPSTFCSRATPNRCCPALADRVPSTRACVCQRASGHSVQLIGWPEWRNGSTLTNSTKLTLTTKTHILAHQKHTHTLCRQTVLKRVWQWPSGLGICSTKGLSHSPRCQTCTKVGGRARGGGRARKEILYFGFHRVRWPKTLYRLLRSTFSYLLVLFLMGF